jgi:hypothetical protein
MDKALYLLHAAVREGICTWLTGFIIAEDKAAVAVVLEHRARNRASLIRQSVQYLQNKLCKRLMPANETGCVAGKSIRKRIGM